MGKHKGKQRWATHRGEMISTPAPVSTGAARLLGLVRPDYPICERTHPTIPSARAQTRPDFSESPFHGPAIALSSAFPTGSPDRRATPRIRPRRNLPPKRLAAAFDHPSLSEQRATRRRYPCGKLRV